MSVVIGNVLERSASVVIGNVRRGCETERKAESGLGRMTSHPENVPRRERDTAGSD